MPALLQRLLYLLRRCRHEADLREEIEAHRALRQAAFERDGLSLDEAARASRRALGNTTLSIEDARDVWVLRTIDTAVQDLRTALRGLLKTPGFALAAMVTLGLGIGANTALFSILDSLVLRQLPARDPERLALLSDGSWTYPIWTEIERVADRIFDGAFAWAEEEFDLSEAGETAIVEGAFVSGGMFEVLGARAARGRTLLPSDDAIGADGAVAVISDRFWREHFGAAPDVVGRRLTLQRIPFTVLGVMPPEFHGPTIGEAMEVMVPFAADRVIRGKESFLDKRSTWWLEIMVRRRPGQTLEQANAALRAVQPQIRAATLPDWPAAMLANYLKDALTLVPGATGRSPLRTQFETPLFAMTVAVGLVLLVACASIASLMLARTLARRHELSVRLALGASRWRLARLLFTESLLLALLGAGAGLLFARWSSALLVAQLNTWEGTVTLDLGLDWPVLAFAAALACGSALIAGLAPLAGVRNVGPAEALKDTGRGIAGDRHYAVRGALVIVQIAVSLILVVAAGLFVRTFTSLSGVPLGFEPRPLLIADLNLLAARVSPDQRARLVDRLREAVAAVPGVTSAAASRMTPLSGGGWNNWVGESDSPPRDRTQQTWINATTSGWFSTMGIPLLAGRDFEERDRLPRPMVAIVNESFVRRFLAAGSPIGQTVDLGGRDMGPYEIVGVVADAVYRRPREGFMPTIYLPVAIDQEWSRMALTIATAPGRRAAVEREVAAALTRVDPSVSFTFRTYDQLLEGTLTRERLVALLSTFFGGLALLIAALGLYGLVAQGVRARQLEIGVRMALGAEPASIVRLVFGRVVILLVAGLAIGGVASVWAARFIGTLLFRVQPRDPATFAGAAAVLVAVSIVAAWLPAQRAARLDPASVLRQG
jgi:predicted permease